MNINLNAEQWNTDPVIFLNAHDLVYIECQCEG